MVDTPAVHDNTAASRYEVRLGGDVAFLKYRDSTNGARILVHTEVPAAFEGRGIGALLAKTALDEALTKGRHIVPQCPFVRSYIGRHPEYEPLTRR